MKMYTWPKFRTKKALKEAVASGVRVTVDNPGFGPNPPHMGKAYICGPASPQPHKWYAEVSIEHGEVVRVIN